MMRTTACQAASGSTSGKAQRNEPKFDARTELHRLCGVDLTQVPGVQINTALVLFTELEPDFVQRFPTAKHFVLGWGCVPTTASPEAKS